MTTRCPHRSTFGKIMFHDWALDGIRAFHILILCLQSVSGMWKRKPGGFRVHDSLGCCLSCLLLLKLACHLHVFIWLRGRMDWQFTMHLFSSHTFCHSCPAELSKRRRAPNTGSACFKLGQWYLSYFWSNQSGGALYIIVLK